jgi:UPF0755 protein
MRKLVYIVTAIIVLVTLSNCATSNQFRWTKTSLLLADSIGLSKEQVIILASIVEKETNFLDERSKIARVYLNRIKKGMYLQSDQTVMFALQDTTSKHITEQQLTIDSPYDTYKHKGLPPGPICKPSKESILAVLKATKHNNLYFCPKPDMSEHFNYAETYKEHIKNSKLYMEGLNK